MTTSALRTTLTTNPGSTPSEGARLLSEAMRWDAGEPRAPGYRDAKASIGQALAARPELVDEALALASPAQGKALARMGLEGFAQGVSSDPSKRTGDNYGRVVSLLEQIDPNAETKDVSREIRRTYYPDHGAFMNLGDNHTETGASQELKDMTSRISPSLRRMQEVAGPDGQPFDIAHSMVSVDARTNNPYTGRLRAAIYTDVGDGIQGMVSMLGLNAAGNNNISDRRGNDFGEQLGDAAVADEQAKLSQLLKANLTPTRFRP